MAVPVVCMVVSEIVGYIVYIFTEKPGETFFGWRLYAFGLAGIIMAVLLMRSRIPCNFITVTIFTFISVFVIYGGIMNIAAMMMTRKTAHCSPRKNTKSVPHGNALLAGSPICLHPSFK